MKKRIKIYFLAALMTGAMLLIAMGGSAFALQEVMYSDSGIAAGSSIYTWQELGITSEITNTGLPEGKRCQESLVYSSWAGWGIFYAAGSNHVVDLSAYEDGYLKFWVKTPANLKVEIQLTGTAGTKISKHIASYGWDGTNRWQEISIPINAFTSNVADLKNIFSPFMITAEVLYGSYYVDYVRWSDNNSASPAVIKLYPNVASIAVGSQKEFIAKGFDLRGNLVAISPTWTIIPATGVGTIVSTNGNRVVIRGDAAGGITVKATVDSWSGISNLTVAAPETLSTIIYNIYSDKGLPSGVGSMPQIPGEAPSGPTCTEVTTGAPEGNNFYQTVIGTDNWGGWRILLPAAEDLHLYLGGSLKFYVKSNVKLGIKLKGGDKESTVKPISLYGWAPSANWQSITIPLVDFALDDIDFHSMQNVFLVETQDSPGHGTAFSIDHVRYEAPYAPERSIIEISGRQLKVNNVLFTVKGVCYAPTPVGEGYRTFDISAHPEIYQRDFRIIKAMGANTIRIYKPPTNVAFLDAAFSAGLYVIMDYNIAHDASLTDLAVRNVIKSEFLSMVNTYKNHPAILMWNFGNEINVHLNGLSFAGWYGFVNECAAAAHAAEDGKYHPVTAACAEGEDIATEISNYNSLVPSLDAWAVQSYRGAKFGNLFSSIASKTSKPLILTEFGCDSYDMANGREDLAQQASYLQSQWDDISNNLSQTNADNISIGGSVFELSDDWSKAQLGMPDPTHDTVGLYPNAGYYDYVNGEKNMNEEWWGICGISPTDPTKMLLRPAYVTLRQAWKGTGSFTGSDLEDATLILQMMTGIPQMLYIQKEADVNGDKRIGIEEVISILQKVKGMR